MFRSAVTLADPTASQRFTDWNRCVPRRSNEEHESLKHVRGGARSFLSVNAARHADKKSKTNQICCMPAMRRDSHLPGCPAEVETEEEESTKFQRSTGTMHKRKAVAKGETPVSGRTRVTSRCCGKELIGTFQLLVHGCPRKRVRRRLSSSRRRRQQQEVR